ncbi:MAG: hypothetical protein C4288_14530 [Leptolyngbya sp. ERB_1_1]
MFYQDQGHFRIRKTHAVFTATFLVFLAFLLARSLPLLIPKEKPELELVVNSVFLLFSFGIVNAIVGEAIEDAAAEKHKEYLKTESSDGIRTLQELEYYSEIPFEFRRRSTKLLGVQGSGTLEDIVTESRIRNAIVCGFANEPMLRRLALKACAVALGSEDDKSYLENDRRFGRFREDVYIYLRAWLIMSIKYKRAMPLELIQQGFPDEASPDKYAYVRAIRYIRETSIDKSGVEECLDANYRGAAKVILRQELDKLIKTLQE